MEAKNVAEWCNHIAGCLEIKACDYVFEFGHFEHGLGHIFVTSLIVFFKTFGSKVDFKIDQVAVSEGAICSYVLSGCGVGIAIAIDKDIECPFGHCPLHFQTDDLKMER